ncbi:target of Nesh-SH3 isoform 10-T10 [Discoglossus pictus]
MVSRLLLLLLCGIISARFGNAQKLPKVKKLNMKVNINATGDTLIMKFIRPNNNLKLEGFILGYGSNFFSNQYVQWPENGKSYVTEVDAEPRYLIAVKPNENNKKSCKEKNSVQKPLQLVVGTLTPSSVFLSWGILINPQIDWSALNKCPNDRFYTVRYREKNKDWLFQLCPTTETVIDNLKPNTMYEFSVKDNTDDGIWSKCQNHKTIPKSKVNGQNENTYKIPKGDLQVASEDTKAFVPIVMIKQGIQNVTNLYQPKSTNVPPSTERVSIHKEEPKKPLKTTTTKASTPKPKPASKVTKPFPTPKTSQDSETEDIEPAVTSEPIVDSFTPDSSTGTLEWVRATMVTHPYVSVPNISPESDINEGSQTTPLVLIRETNGMPSESTEMPLETFPIMETSREMTAATETASHLSEPEVFSSLEEPQINPPIHQLSNKQLTSQSTITESNKPIPNIGLPLIIPTSLSEPDATTRTSVPVDKTISKQATTTHVMPEKYSTPPYQTITKLTTALFGSHVISAIPQDIVKTEVPLSITEGRQHTTEGIILEAPHTHEQEKITLASSDIEKATTETKPEITNKAATAYRTTSKPFATNKPVTTRSTEPKLVPKETQTIYIEEETTTTTVPNETQKVSSTTKTTLLAERLPPKMAESETQTTSPPIPKTPLSNILSRSKPAPKTTQRTPINFLWLDIFGDPEAPNTTQAPPQPKSIQRTERPLSKSASKTTQRTPINFLWLEIVEDPEAPNTTKAPSQPKSTKRAERPQPKSAPKTTQRTPINFLWFEIVEDPEAPNTTQAPPRPKSTQRAERPQSKSAPKTTQKTPINFLWLEIFGDPEASKTTQAPPQPKSIQRTERPQPKPAPNTTQAPPQPKFTQRAERPQSKLAPKTTQRTPINFLWFEIVGDPKASNTTQAPPQPKSTQRAERPQSKPAPKTTQRTPIHFLWFEIVGDPKATNTTQAPPRSKSIQRAERPQSKLAPSTTQRTPINFLWLEIFEDPEAPKTTQAPPQPKSTQRTEHPQTKPVPYETQKVSTHKTKKPKPTVRPRAKPASTGAPKESIKPKTPPHSLEATLAPYKLQLSSSRPKTSVRPRTRPAQNGTTQGSIRARANGDINWIAGTIPGGRAYDNTKLLGVSRNISMEPNNTGKKTFSVSSPPHLPVRPTSILRRILPNNVTGRPGSTGSVLVPRAPSAIKPNRTTVNIKTPKKQPTLPPDEDTVEATVFSPNPKTDVDVLGKPRYTGPHVVYVPKPDLVPCSITDTLKHFPTEDPSNQEATKAPENPPSNLTVVTVEGCPSFVILDWEQPDNDTVTEYEVVTHENGAPPGKDTLIITTNQTHSTVEDLKPNTNYSFQVTAKNALGAGPPSPTLPFNTESADPRVSESATGGKDAIWTEIKFKSDIYSECRGKQYVKRTWYKKFVGIQLCNSLRYKMYLSDTLSGTFYNIGDQSGFGEDHCQFVDSFLDGRTGQQLSPEQLTNRKGFYRSVRQQPVEFGEIGERTHSSYVHWYECGVSIPGKW